MKVIEIITDAGHLDTVKGIADQFELSEFWHSQVDENGRCSMRLLVRPEKRQRVMDTIQSLLSASEDSRVIVYATETVWPAPVTEAGESEITQTVTREELYSEVEQGARLNVTYVLMVILSTIVVAIGLIENNVAVVIGAMVIAPLLGPNIALALGAALGDRKLIFKALNTMVVGVGLAFILCLILGHFWTGPLDAEELMSRTDVGLGGMLLALASGLAAALSLTTGLSSVLVGVMVAVALLPPTATAGLMLGSGHTSLAAGAALLLAVNVVSVNLSAKLVFLFKGIRPRTWLAQKKARQSYSLFLTVWFISLSILSFVLYQRL